MKKLLTINELRQNMPDYIKKIKKGASFVVYKRSEPVFRIGPVEEQWETVVDFTEFEPMGVPASKILQAAAELEKEEGVYGQD